MYFPFDNVQQLVNEIFERCFVYSIICLIAYCDGDFENGPRYVILYFLRNFLRSNTFKTSIVTDF